MKISATAQNPLEWFAVKSGLAPEPVAIIHFGYLISKFLLEAIDKQVFETIGKSKITIEEVASNCGLNANALEKLMRLLAAMGLVKNDLGKFQLTTKARKWLLKDSPSSLYWLLMFDQKVCYQWMNYAGEFLTTGKGLDYHKSFNSEEWFYYQKAMEAIANNASREIVRRVPPLARATAMLDIGGAHGLYAAAFCKKYSSLHATILDLPGAVEQVNGFENATSSIKDRLTFEAGDILHHDIGSEKYDLVLMASVAHHLTQQENMLVANKVYEALKPGGMFTIVEVPSPGPIKKNENMLAALGDIFFSFSSTSGTWSVQLIKHWMTEAGLTIIKKSSFLFLPGYVAITGKKL